MIGRNDHLVKRKKYFDVQKTNFQIVNTFAANFNET